MTRSLSLLFALLYTVSTHAQQAVLPTGGEATGTGGTVSYSVGQVAYTTTSSSTGTMTQGVQQPYEVIATSLVEESNGQLMATAFPNPASSLINIHLQSMVENGNDRLVDGLGQLMLQGRIDGTDDTIDMAALPAASYVLLLFRNETPIGSFTVIKH
ncbi:MAG: hypothetical protein IT229_11555 [Flavobacteriales bacterium]|nr:hypothetical protein [Flavobacteriales bacterium]